jgi:hypothetical protein
VIVLKSIPLGLRSNVVGSSYVHHHLVTVYLSLKPCAIVFSHLVVSQSENVLSPLDDFAYELVRVRWVTNALEELDSFLTF